MKKPHRFPTAFRRPKPDPAPAELTLGNRQREAIAKISRLSGLSPNAVLNSALDLGFQFSTLVAQGIQFGVSLNSQNNAQAPPAEDPPPEEELAEESGEERLKKLRLFAQGLAPPTPEDPDPYAERSLIEKLEWADAEAKSEPPEPPAAPVDGEGNA